VLRVHLQKGIGLKAADLNGKSDPYVVLQCGSGESKKSKVVRKTLDPEWDETIDLMISTLADALKFGLTLKVMDKDTLSRDDPLGTITADLSLLNEANGPHAYSEPLPTQGGLLFSVTWQPLTQTVLPPPVPPVDPYPAAAGYAPTPPVPPARFRAETEDDDVMIAD